MRVLVTGATGFLGRALIRTLRERGVEVRGFTRREDPALRAAGVELSLGDLGDAEALFKAAAGCDALFHAGAKVSLWGEEREFERVNVQGTRNVLAACRRRGVPKLVHTSTPSVVFDGTPLEGCDESKPYPARHLNAYSRSKAEAERLVLEANGPGLACVALRPHMLWGPGDPHIAPGILERGRAGTLFKIAGASPIVDGTYIDNAAEAHLLALERLAEAGQERSPAGKAYFIAQGEPMPFWDFVAKILALEELPPPSRSAPAWLARGAAFCLEGACAPLGLEPPLTRYLAAMLTASHWFDLSAARRDLGYRARVSVEEGLRRLGESLSAGRSGGAGRRFK